MKSELTIDEFGDKEWRLPNGVYHREDGPACEYEGGNKYWYINGKLHREDGHACEWANGDKWWFLNGIKYTEQEYKYKMRSVKLRQLLENLT